MWIVWKCVHVDVCYFGGTCTFGDNNEMWIICMWFDDFFCNDDFFSYIFEMMNCICWDWLS